MIHGLRDDHAARNNWLAIIDQLGATPERRSGYSPAFDAIALLHHGDAALALERLGTQPHEPNKRPIGIWLHWHLALRAEAAVLAGHPDANHLAAARPMVAGNPIATAILDRAAALLDDDHERLLSTATAFETAGCPYQRARTLVLAGGDTASTGNAALVDLGLTPAAVTG
jgi:hypothetical protein